MEKTIQSVSRWTNGIGLCALGLMVLVVTGDVVGRYFGFPVPGAFELNELLIVVLIGLGLAYTQAEKGNVAVGILVDRFSPRTQAFFDCLASVAGLIIAILLVWQTFLHGMMSLRAGEITCALQIPLFPFKFLIAFGALMWAFELIVELVRSTSNLRGPTKG